MSPPTHSLPPVRKRTKNLCVHTNTIFLKSDIFLRKGRMPFTKTKKRGFIMKKLFKTLAALAVVAALGFGFVSCGGGDDDNNGNSGNNNTNPAQTETALAVFTCDSGYDKRTLTFNEDSTFKVIVSDETGSQAEGTYTFDSGDWENGTITLTATSGSKASTFTGTKTISEKKIIFSSKEYTLTGGTKKTPSTDSTKTDTTKTDTTTKEPEYYTVTFDTKGGSAIEEYKLKKGERFYNYSNYMTTEKDGYYFVYWCSDSDATEKFNFGIVLESDITLYAKWEAVPSNINKSNEILQKFDDGNSSYYLYFLKDGTFRYYSASIIYAGVYEFTDGYNDFSDGAKFTMTSKCRYLWRHWEKYSYGETKSYTITMKENRFKEEVMYFRFIPSGENPFDAYAVGQRF